MAIINVLRLDELSGLTDRESLPSYEQDSSLPHNADFDTVNDIDRWPK
jgi:hypothetical protein